MSTLQPHAAPPASTPTTTAPRISRVTAGIPMVVAPTPRIAAVISNVAWVGIAAHAAFVPMFSLFGHTRLAAFNIASVAMWIAAWLANRHGRSTLGMWLLTAEVVAHAVLAVMILGWASGFQYYLIPLIPFVMFNDRLRRRSVALISAGVFATLIALRAVAPEGEGGAAGGPLAAVLRYGNLAIPMLALALVSYYFRSASTSAERRMESIAHTDPLTGLLNRRSMEQRLREAAHAFQRTGSPFSVVMADVDLFKRVNDVHGHAVGDRVLRAVAALLGEQLRTHDAVARWGGEEFLLLLPETDAAAACEVAERVRAIAEARVAQASGLGAEAPVTLTFGVAVFGRGTRVAECLKAADEALYAGKAAGRNRVVGA